MPGDPRIGAAPGVPEEYLIAISLGSVFCGAITYIGNGPNFMVKAVADADSVRMPTFGGYAGWSLRSLVPVLAAMVLIVRADGLTWNLLGVALGFIGLGAIGRPMAANLVRAGFDVIGVGPFERNRELSAELGISAVGSVAELDAVDAVVVMVATPDQLAEVVGSAGPRLQNTLWIVMSTVGPESVRRAAARIEAAGGTVIDAPVSGGVARATTGELSIFASGAQAHVAAADAVLRALGNPRTVGGRVGDGQAIKVVNQHLCSVHLVAAAEALALSERLGLDPAFVLDTIGPGAAGSFMLDDRGPRMLQSPDAEVLSTVGIFVKDSGLVAEAGQAAGMELPVLDAARQRFLAAAERGLAANDDSSVIETYR